jgi:hypothetical protein
MENNHVAARLLGPFRICSAWILARPDCVAGRRIAMLFCPGELPGSHETEGIGKATGIHTRDAQ